MRRTNATKNGAENIKWGLFAKMKPNPDDPHTLHVRKIETLRWDLLIDRKKALMFGVRYYHSLN